MTATLTQQADVWVLDGCVSYDQAESLAQTLVMSSESPCLIQLQQAQGGTALLLVLLSWHRTARQRGVRLEFHQPSQELLRVAELSGLDVLLPFAKVPM